MKKYKIASLAFVFSIVFTPLAAGAQTPLVTAPTEPAIISQIKSAKAQLDAVSLTYQLTPHTKKVSKKVTTGTGKKKKTTTQTSTVLANYTLDNRDVVVAVQNPATAEPYR